MLDNEQPVITPSSPLDEVRKFLGDYITTNKEGGRLWTILTALRGPDTPSERPDMTYLERDEAYNGRRKRKYDTVEIIRAKAFFGKVGGSARYHLEDEVRLPPSGEWDHFDKHVAEAAAQLGLKIEPLEGEKKRGGAQVTFSSKKEVKPEKVEFKTGASPWKIMGGGGSGKFISPTSTPCSSSVSMTWKSLVEAEDKPMKESAELTPILNSKGEPIGDLIEFWKNNGCYSYYTNCDCGACLFTKAHATKAKYTLKDEAEVVEDDEPKKCQDCDNLVDECTCNTCSECGYDFDSCTCNICAECGNHVDDCTCNDEDDDEGAGDIPW